MNRRAAELNAAEADTLKKIEAGRLVYAQAPHECEGLMACGFVEKRGGKMVLTRQGKSHLASLP